MVGRFLSRFRQPKVNFELKVNDANFYPGSTVDVDMVLLPQQQFAVRDAQIRLVCAEVWWKPPGGLSRADYLLTPENWGQRIKFDKQTTELVRLEEPLSDDGQVLLEIEYRKHLQFKLPDDALPTIKGDVANISWQLHGYINGEQYAPYNPVHKIVDVEVLSAPMTADGSETAAHSEATFEQCELELDVSSSRAQVGETISGTFRLRCKENIHLYWIRVDLECAERSGVATTKQFTRVIFGKEMRFQANELREWPFEIRVPNNGSPTASVHETKVSWVLRAGADPRWGKVFSVSTPIEVYKFSKSDDGYSVTSSE